MELMKAPLAKSLFTPQYKAFYFRNIRDTFTPKAIVSIIFIYRKWSTKKLNK